MNYSKYVLKKSKILHIGIDDTDSPKGMCTTFLSYEIIKDVKPYLIENTSTTIAFNDLEPIEVRIPVHIALKITDTDPGEKGNTAQGGTKPATLETGLVIQVPLFLQIGDSIRIDTRENKYIERVK